MAANQNDNSSDGLLYGVFFIAALAGVWYLFGQQIAVGYLFTKKMEYWVLRASFLDKLLPALWDLHVSPAEAILFGNKSKFTFTDLKIVGSGIGYFSRFYYAVAFFFVGKYVLAKNPLQKFRRIHSMQTLVQSEQRLWPAIAPVAGLELIPQDIDKGPWAMSRKPLDFARYYKLLDEGNKLNRERSEKLFAMQLGKLWEGTDKLPAYARALFVCFAAQACGDLKSAKQGLEKLSLSLAHGKEDYSWVPALLAKHEKDARVTEVVKKHAYVYTVMASMLKAARDFGVMQTPLFIWLRPKNRQLWYILNGVGRRVAFAEVGGIYAHWIAEEVAQHPIERPYVVKAVDGLERALLEVKID